MARIVSPMMRELARLFVHGPPGVRGNWKQAGLEAGYKRADYIPKFTSPVMRELVAAEGGYTQASQLDLSSIDYPDPDDPDADEKWKALGKKVLPVWHGIAAGNVAGVTTQQVAAIRDIIDRAYGKAGKDVKDDVGSDIGVLILPALEDENGLATVCPRCTARLVEEGV